MTLTRRLAIGYVRTKFKLLSSISKKKAAAEAFALFCTPQRRTRGQLPAFFAEAETLGFRFGSDAITGWRWNKGAGRRVLILHGFESSAINFEWYARQWVQKGYEVLAFDAPAHGRSGGKRIDVLLYRDFILAIQQRFGPITSFLAHSLGGLALALAMERMPHHENFRLALVAPAASTATALSHFLAFLGLNDPELRREVEEIIFQRTGHPLAWFSIDRTLAGIRATICWVQDEEDPITPVTDIRDAQAGGHPHVRFTITRGLGHRRIYRDAEVGKTIVDFL